jgi:hypothetical protein
MDERTTLTDEEITSLGTHAEEVADPDQDDVDTDTDDADADADLDDPS